MPESEPFCGGFLSLFVLVELGFGTIHLQSWVHNVLLYGMLLPAGRWPGSVDWVSVLKVQSVVAV